MAENTGNIKNIKKGFLGTIEFDLKADGHRGFQNFSFYPQDKLSKLFTVQSDKRIGLYNAETGEFRLSKSRSGGSYNMHLHLDKLISVKLSEDERKQLNAELLKTASNTGNSVIQFDNSGALSIQ